MDFSFNIETVLRCDQNGMLIINSSHKKFMKFDYYYYLEMVINSIGSLSSVQRRLKSPITNADLFFGKQNETLIIKAKGNTVFGFIRVGYKDIYINTLNDVLENINLLCVFDFFVHFTCQRMGYGRELFDKVLELFKVEPSMMAYDKPSQAMNNFMYKHYSLKNPIEQSNHMFIYYQLLLKLINENYNEPYQSTSLIYEELNKGILPRTIDYLFSKSKSMEGSKVSLSCSFIEIYMEQVSDLLNPSNNGNKSLNIQCTGEKVIVDGLSKLSIDFQSAGSGNQFNIEYGADTPLCRPGCSGGLRH